VGEMTRTVISIRAPSTMLRMVPLPRFAGEDQGRRPAASLILLRLRGRGTAEGGGGGVSGSSEHDT